MRLSAGILILAVAIIFISLVHHGAYAHEGEEEATDGYSLAVNPENPIQNDRIPLTVHISKDGVDATGLQVTLTVDRHEAGISDMIQAAEREPGNYFAYYAFKEPGDYEIHVEFMEGGGPVRHTVNVQVAGTSWGVELYFLAAAIIAFAAVWAIEMRKGKHVRRATVLSLVVLGIMGLVYSLYITQTSGAAAQGITVCVSPEECYWTAHVHTEVDVEICGEDIRLPIETGRLDRPHTHEEKNLIHWHDRLPMDPATKRILNTEPLTLGAFFDELQVPLSETQVMDKENGDLCPNGQPGTLKAFVNGAPAEDIREYVWKDGDKVAIVFDERPAETIASALPGATVFQSPEISLPIIVGFALLDSINPCVIGVLLLLITMLLKAKQRRKVLINGAAYSIGVYATYLIGGLTLLGIFNAVRGIVQVSQGFYLVIGAFIIIAGFFEIKDYFWYGRGFSLAIPARFVKTIEKRAQGTHSGIGTAIIFGAIVTLIELPCTGAPYLAVLTLMSQSGMAFYSALLLLLLYNLIFILPLIIIIYIAYTGVGTKKMEGWRQEHRGLMRLLIGLSLVAVGIWAVFSIAEYMLVPLSLAILLVIIGMAVAKKAGVGVGFEMPAEGDKKPKATEGAEGKRNKPLGKKGRRRT
ncbi:MAG: GAP family protein [Candidatus Aenigmarchaeota archaeon]|nr:GAP family protein [Candidatus Aenigmarchaeota archaeon]